jgi:aminoglycoside phosphotransferase (APT) family kinase protein
MSSLIPEPRRKDVADALHTTFGAKYANPCFTPLTGGMSGALLARFAVADTDYVLRLEPAANAMSDPARHFSALTAAAEAGVAPRVFHTDPETGVAIMAFVAQQPLAGFPGGREALLIEGASRLHALQTLPAPPPMTRHLDSARRFITAFQATGLITDQAIGEHLLRFSQMDDVWPADPGSAFSHNDLNPGNVVSDGQRLWFIDWAVADGADPFGDPACLANTLGLEETQEPLFLETWLGQVPTERDAARFHLMRLVWPMVQAMLILTVVARARPDLASPSPVLTARSLSQVHADIGAGRLDMASAEGRLDYGKALLDELLTRLRSPRYDRALRVLAA